jgi:hypothetical protein
MLAGMKPLPLLLLCFSALVPGGRTRAESIDVTITEVPYREVHAFLHLDGELGPLKGGTGGVSNREGRHIGARLGLMSARRTNLQFVTALGWRRLELKRPEGGEDRRNVGELMLGGRFYPLTPTFALGNLVVRLTASAAGGVVLGTSLMDLSAYAGAGFTVGMGDDPSALAVELIYRPLGFTMGDAELDEEVLKVEPSWGIRAGFLFGP